MEHTSWVRNGNTESAKLPLVLFNILFQNVKVHASKVVLTIIYTNFKYMFYGSHLYQFAPVMTLFKVNT